MEEQISWGELFLQGIAMTVNLTLTGPCVKINKIKKHQMRILSTKCQISTNKASTVVGTRHKGDEIEHLFTEKHRILSQ